MDYEPVNLLFPGDVNQPLILLEVTLGNTSVVPSDKKQNATNTNVLIQPSVSQQAVPLIIYTEEDAFRTTEEFCQLHKIDGGKKDMLFQAVQEALVNVKE